MLIEEFKKSNIYGIYEKALSSMDWSLLVSNKIHGRPHVERVTFFGALISFQKKLSQEDATLVIQSCVYHDIGRVNDHYDTLHGRRGANMLDDKVDPIVQASIATHSEPDESLDYYMDVYGVTDRERCKLVCYCLKDADALDRVRFRDLDLSQLRYPESVELKDFAVKQFALSLKIPVKYLDGVIERMHPFYYYSDKAEVENVI